MGFWADIKYALNSTLGTSDFKPLNTLIIDAIKGQRTLAPSDNIFRHIANDVYVFNGVVDVPTTFSPKTSGAIRLIVSGRNDGEVVMSVTVLTSTGAVIATTNVVTTAVQKTFRVPLDFNISPNEIYKIRLNSTDYYTTNYVDLSIGAIVTDTNLIQLG